MEKEWYVVNTYSGHENKVKEKLEMRASSMGMEDYIHRVVVPAQKEVVVKNGKEVEKESKMFPGYILVEMVMTDEAWFIVRNTPGALRTLLPCRARTFRSAGGLQIHQPKRRILPCSFALRGCPRNGSQR